MRPTGKRIIICCASFPPEIGGAPARIYNLAQLLKGLGYAVTIITAMPNYPTGSIFPAYRGRLICREDQDEIRIIKLWLIPANTRNWVVRGLSLLTQSASILLFAAPQLLFGKARAVLVSSPPLFTAFLYGLLAKAGGKKLLVNISDIWPLTAKELGTLKEGRIMRILSRMERYLYNNAAGIMGQSNAILAHIKEQGGASKPIFLYRNLPHTSDESIVSDIPGPAASPKKIIYAGALGFAQGLLEICQGINFAAYGLELHVYGDGTERAAIDRHLAHNTGSGISLYPSVSPGEFEKVLKSYSAMLIPLRNPIHGAVPSKLFTAVAHNLPVLFCSGGEGEVLTVENGLGFTAPAGDIDAIKGMLATFANTIAEAMNELKGNIQQAHITCFSKAAQDERFEQFLKEIV